MKNKRRQVQVAFFAAIMIVSMMAVGGLVGTAVADDGLPDGVDHGEDGSIVVVDDDKGVVQAAIDHAGEHDEIETVELESGTYDGSVEISADGLTLTAAGDTKPTITGTITTIGQGVTIDNVSVSSQSHAINVQDDVTITHNELSGSGENAVIYHNFDDTHTTSDEIETTITDNEIEGDTGIALGEDGPTVENISNNDLGVDTEGFGVYGIEAADDRSSGELTDDLLAENTFDLGDGAYALKDYESNVKYAPGGELLVQEGDSVQEAVDAASEGETVEISPGTYDVSAEDREPYASSQDKMGLYIGTDDVTIRGVDDDGEPISDTEDVRVEIISQASTAFGTNGPFVAADGVTIDGIEITPNSDASPNKNLEVAGDEFTLSDSIVNGNVGSVYFNTDGVQNLSVTGNDINAGLSFNDGVGNETDATDASDRIVRNNDIGLISFAGEQEDVDWRNHAIGPVTIEDNTIEGHSETLIIDEEEYVYEGVLSRVGTSTSAMDWDSIVEENTFERGVVIRDDTSPTGVKDIGEGSKRYEIQYGIQSAVDDTTEDDTVEVLAGSYDESVTIDTENVTLEALDNSEETVIDGETENAVTVLSNDVTVEGFSITTDVDDRNDNGAVSIGTPSQTDVTGAEIRGNRINDTVVGVLDYGSGGEHQIVENEFVNTAQSGGFAVHRAAPTGNGVEINGNTFAGGDNVAIYAGTGGSAITITGNEISDFGYAGISMDEMTDVVISENTVIENEIALEVYGGSDIEVTENGFENNGQAIEYDGEGAAIDADRNWWGAVTGPHGDGDPISENVDVASWYLDEDRETLTEDLTTPITVNEDGTADVTEIQTAIDLIELGEIDVDTIDVEDGEYSEELTVAVEGLTLRAADDAEPEIVAPEDAGIGGAETVVEASANDVHIEGLSIYEDLSGVQPTALALTGDNVEAIGNDIERADESGNPLIGVSGDSPTVSGNDLIGGPIGVTSSGDVNVTENTIAGEVPDEAIWFSDEIDHLDLANNDVSETTTDGNDDGSADLKLMETPTSINDEDVSESDVAANVLIGDNDGSDTIELWDGQTYDENGNVVVKEGDSINEAIDNAGAGATVLLDGEFEQDVTVEHDRVSLEATEDTVIVGQDTGHGGALEIDADDVSVSGLAVEAAGESAVYVRSGTEGFQLSGSTIKTADGTESRPHGLLFETGGTSDHLIESNTFELNSDGDEDPILAYVNGDASGPGESTNVSFVENTFTGSSVGNGIVLGHEATDSRIVENEFDVESDYGQLEAWASDTVIEDNEFEVYGGFHIRGNGENIDDDVLAENEFDRAIFVDETSDGSEKVFATLNSALADASEGSTLSFSSGVFDDATDVDTKGVTLEGPNAGVAGDSDDRDDEASIEVNGNHEITAEEVVVDGLRFDVGAGDNGIEVTGESVEIRNSVFDAPAIEEFSSATGYAIWIDGSPETNVTDNQFTGGNGAVQITGETEGATVENNRIDTDITGIGQSSGDAGVSGTVVTDNRITVGVQGVSGWNVDGMVVTENTITIDDGDYDDRSEFTNERGVDVTGDSVSITENEISSTHTAVLVESDAGSDVSVTQNDLAGEEWALDASEYEMALEATHNWWGSETGPSGEGPGTGDAITENADYDPWLNAPIGDDPEEFSGAEFTIVDDEVVAVDVGEDDVVEVGERVSFEVDVENVGDITETQEVTLLLDGESVENESVRIGGGDSETVVVDYRIRSDDLDEGADTEIGFTVETSADGSAEEIISITDTQDVNIDTVEDVDGETITAGEMISVSVEVSSDADDTDQEVVLLRNGTEVDSESVSLDADESDGFELEDRPTANDLDGADSADFEYEIASATASDGAGTVTVQTPAEFDITGLDVVEDPVTAGEEIELEVTVENVATETDDTTVTVRFDGDRRAEFETNELGENAEQTVTGTIETDEGDIGHRTVRASTGDDSETEGVSVEAPAEFVVSVDDIDPADPIAGEDGIEIDVDVTNVGGVEATQEVALRVGETENEQEFTLDGGESDTAEFTIDEIGEPGPSEVTAQSEDTSQTAMIDVREPANLVTEIVEVTDPVRSDEPLTVGVSVYNAGEADSDDAEVDLFVDGTEVATENVDTLSPGDGEFVSIEHDALDTDDEGSVLDVRAETRDTEDDATADVVAPPEDALFRVDAFNLDGEVLRDDGETLDVDTWIENAGERTGTQDVDLVVSGETVATATVEDIGAGDVQAISFEVDATELSAGERTVAVETDDRVRERTTLVRDPEPAQFDVTVDDRPDEFSGATNEVDVTVRNLGDETDTQTIELDLEVADVQFTDSEEVTLDARESETVTFDIDVTGEPVTGTFGAEIYVESDDSSTAIGSVVDFGSDVDAAIDAASDGGEVLIGNLRGGDQYDVSLDVDEPVTLRGVDDPVFTADGDTAVTVSESNVELTGATFAGGTDDATAIDVQADDVVVSNVDISGSNYATGVNVAGDDVRVGYTTIQNVGDTAVPDDGDVDVPNTDAGITVRGSNAEIADSRIRDVTGVGVVVTGTADGLEIADSELIGNGLGVYSDSGDHVMTRNNVEVNDVAAISATDGTETFIDAPGNWWGSAGGAVMGEDILSPVDPSDPLAQPNEDAEFQVEIAATESEPVVGEDTIDVEVAVSNDGGTAALTNQQEIELTVDGRTVDSEVIGLDADGTESDSTTVHFTAPASEAGEASVEVSSDDDLDTETVMVLSPPSFEITLDDAPANLESGETLSVDATVENVGDADGSTPVGLFLDGSELAFIDDEEIAGGEQESVTLTAELDESAVGTDLQLQAAVLGSTAFDTITVNEAEDETTTVTRGGGGAGTASTEPVTASVGTSITDVDADAPGTTVSIPHSGVNTITFTDDSASGTVSVSVYDGVPSNAPPLESGQPFLSGISVDVPSAQSDQAATLELVVPGDAVESAGVEADDLVVLHAASDDSEYDTLDTTVTDANGDVTIEAETPGFSTFIVTAEDEREEIEETTEETEETEEPVETETTEQPETEDAAATDEPDTPVDEPAEFPVPGFGIVVAVLALLAAALIATRRN